MTLNGIKERIGIRTKIMAVFTGLVVLLGFAVIYIVQGSVVRSLEHELINRGVTIARDIAEEAALSVFDKDNRDIQKDISFKKKIHSTEKATDIMSKHIPGEGLKHAAHRVETNIGPVYDIAVTIPGEPGGHVHVGLSAEPVRKAVDSTTKFILFYLAGVLVIVSIAACFLTNAVLRPILELSEKAEKVGHGEFDIKVEVKSRDEVGRLANSFNRMVENLRISKEALESANVELETKVQERTLELLGLNDELMSEIDEHNHAEEALRVARHDWKDTFDSITDIITIHDMENNVIDANAAARKMLDISEGDLGSVKCYKLIHGTDAPPEGCPNLIALKTGKPSTAEFNEPHLGKFLEIHSIPRTGEDGNIIGVIHIVRDISERKRTEEEMLRLEKLESMGVLAGGLAHDFNNLLMGITGNLSILKHRLGTEGKYNRLLSDAEKAANMARDLTRQLMTFSKGGEPVKKALPLPELTEAAMKLALTGTSIMSQADFKDDIWAVCADEGQLSQVLNNIALNSVHAMPGGGVITARGKNVTITGDSGLPLEKGDYVKLTISDTGAGIPEKYLSKVFDPYFTTKQSGSGLGLASVHSIIKRHGGHIAVKSTVGRGTCFDIYLPASKKRLKAAEARAAVDYSGSGRVLVMDDEEVVQFVLAEMLRSFGYEYETAFNGEEAVAFYKKAWERGEPFDAVIIDLTIKGGMGGRDTIKALREYDPDVRALLSSGYSDDPTMSEYKEHGFKGILVKPYEIASLGRELKRILSGDCEGGEGKA